MASEEPDLMGWAYILFNEANSHLPKVHLLTPKKESHFQTSSEDTCEDQGKLEKVEFGEEN